MGILLALNHKDHYKAIIRNDSLILGSEGEKIPVLEAVLASKQV